MSSMNDNTNKNKKQLTQFEVAILQELQCRRIIVTATQLQEVKKVASILSDDEFRTFLDMYQELIKKQDLNNYLIPEIKQKDFSYVFQTKKENNYQ